MSGRLRIVFAGASIADSGTGFRVLETSHPPVYYLPPADLARQWLVPSERRSFCEFKGLARYWSLVVGSRRAIDCAWSYDEPTASFAPIRGYLAFYAGPMDACYVDDQRVEPQPGGFYGGWITPNIVGPFKGAAGTLTW